MLKISIFQRFIQRWSGPRTGIGQLRLAYVKFAYCLHARMDACSPGNCAAAKVPTSSANHVILEDFQMSDDSETDAQKDKPVSLRDGLGVLETIVWFGEVILWIAIGLVRIVAFIVVGITSSCS